MEELHGIELSESQAQRSKEVKMKENLYLILDYYGQKIKVENLVCLINVEKNRLECTVEIKEVALAPLSKIEKAEFYIPIEFFGQLKKKSGKYLT